MRLERQPVQRFEWVVEIGGRDYPLAFFKTVASTCLVCVILLACFYLGRDLQAENFRVTAFLAQGRLCDESGDNCAYCVPTRDENKYVVWDCNKPEYLNLTGGGRSIK